MTTEKDDLLRDIKQAVLELGGDRFPDLMAALDELTREQAKVPACKTCNDNGRIGGPSYYQPDEGGEPCPDCTTQPVGNVFDGYAACLHQRYSYDQCEQTGKCFDCGAEGRMQFVVFGGNGYEASMLRNLLAVIHRDGGQYLAEHGLVKALEDAVAKVTAQHQPSPANSAEVNERAILTDDANEALDLLAELFDAYEDGTSCYEEPEDCSGYVGNAILLDADTEKRCVDLLDRLRPINAQQSTEGK